MILSTLGLTAEIGEVSPQPLAIVPARKPLHVLIVEDSSADAALVIYELERGGYDVIHERVQTADAMRAALARGGWDLVLSDYRMPNFSGTDALALLQNASVDLPFIVISGTIGEETAVTALKAGAHDFLVKGRLARLVPAVERALRDVTDRHDRRTAEDALRVSEARYRSLVEHSVFGIYQASIEGRFLTVNPALVVMLGYESPRDLLAVHLGSVYADPAVFTDLVRRAGEKGDLAGAEAMWKRRSGEQIRVRLSGRLMTASDSGQPVFEVIVEDVTEQYRLHEELRQAQKMEAVGQLAGGVAHDFNNMLTAILGYAELLTEQIGPDKPIGQDLREIQAAAERAAALTRQLLAFSRKQVLTIKPVDLSAIVRTVEPMLRRLLGEPIKIETKLADALDLVMADASQLEHLLINLAVNARDAMPRGGTLTISTSNLVLDHRFAASHPGAKAGCYAALGVNDTGIGMPQEIQRRIFEPFFTTKERGRGTGLGLAAVYGIVKQLNGYIAVESDVGRGSTFTVHLPRTGNGAKASETVAVSNAPPVGHETILLVEDEGGVRAFTRIALKRFGYRVVEAESAEVALKLVDGFNGPIDLLLTDVILPGIDGRELAHRLRRMRTDLRVLFMSGYTAELRTVDGFLIPGVQLLEKPFTAQALLARTRQVLGTSAEPPEPRRHA